MNVAVSDNALKVLQHRYLKRDRHGTYTETPAGMFSRVAKAIAGAEIFFGKSEDAAKWEEIFYDKLCRLLFLPNSPTLMNAGTPLSQLSACFVLPVEDSMERIFTTLKHAALIQQSGGGTGFNFSQLRPKNDYVSSTGGIASGPVSFMKIFDAVTEQIKQGGKRRGANMGILNIDHPDIEEFICCKQEELALNSFNISVGITDAFMEVLKTNSGWELKHPSKKHAIKTVPAARLWDAIVENAWKTGDPGIIFLDTINAANPTPQLGEIEATNPCGEVPLLQYEACNLGSINLAKFVTQDKVGAEIDWTNLAETIRIAVRFLDNVIEINNYLVPETKSIVQGNRKIGLGVMGWADLLVSLEIPYDSAKAIELAHKLMRFLQMKSFDASVELARQRGVFKNWEQSIYYPHRPVRNATTLSIAPTGTISLIADTSSSIEPLFALAFERQHVLDNERMVSVNHQFMNYLKKHGLFSDKNFEQVLREGTAKNIAQLPTEVKNIFKTAPEIAPEWHLKHQAVFQQYTDNAVSKTINLPQSATKEDIGKIYQLAWQQKLKGITIFRYNSKQRQVLHSGVRAKADGCKVCVE